MKEYKTGFFKNFCTPRQMLLLPVLIAISVGLNILVARVPAVPLWLESFGALIGCCTGGAWFGGVVALAAGLIEMALGEGLIALGLSVVTVGVVFLFDVMIHMGLFSRARGIFFAVVFCSLLDSCLRIPINLAAHGGIPQTNSMVSALFYLFSAWLPVPLSSSIATFLANLIDKSLVLFAAHALICHLPKPVAEYFSIRQSFPQLQIENTAADSEFVSEKDRLREKAQTKLDEKKAAESGKAAGGPSGAAPDAARAAKGDAK